MYSFRHAACVSIWRMLKLTPYLLTAALLFTCLGGSACIGGSGAPPKNPDIREEVSLANDQGCLRMNDDPTGPCLANPQNCESIQISYQDNLTCETCLRNGESSTHCGQSQFAECSNHENDWGDTCTICQSVSGAIFFDDCHNQRSSYLPGSCETHNDAVTGETCEFCYDELGEVISRNCFPQGYNCEEWRDDDLLCHRCTQGNEVVSEGCESQVVAPETCEGFTSEEGLTCYICTDSDGNVVDHNCSEPDVVHCETYTTQEGIFCEVCYDRNNAEVRRDCEVVSAPNEECREYRSEDNICTICFDDDNNMTRRDCDAICPGAGMACNQDSDCMANDEDPAGGGICREGVCACQCELFTDEDGLLCEICGDLNNDGQRNELDANCFPAPIDPVNCWNEQRSGPEGDMVCRICESESGGRTEDCDPNTGGDVTCSMESTSDGDPSCEVCRDSSGQVVHSSCGLVCEDSSIHSMRDNSVPVECQICTQDNQLWSVACDMQNVCDEETQLAPPDFPPEGYLADACGNVWLSTQPKSCENPWEVWWYDTATLLQPAEEGEILRAYYWQADPQIDVLAYRVERAFGAGSCDSCDCARGDMIFIYVSMEHAEFLTGTGFTDTIWDYR